MQEKIIEADQVSGKSAGETAIIQAATRLFSEHGFDGVSMRSVAVAAGVSKANIYHHFSSKEALYEAILSTNARELRDLVSGLAGSSGPFEARVTEFAKKHLGHLFGNPDKARLMLREAFSGDEERSKKLIEQVVGNTFQHMTDIFRAGQQAGVLRPDLDPGLCAILLMGLDVFYFQARDALKHIPLAGFAMRPEQFSGEMVDVLLNGMMQESRGEEKRE